ncbi:hypothetical protein TanjilG_03275 [Lupinus angustifolius]|uniref:NOT2/NOT3/NOT5 C-terminal domain-containing protein n=1 Tax=Lupinus angustifolius TaxID=3871 RepID=A0A4P1RD68_LUPAN|nr:hypothetical protein TanjilG_03275 [Lupinus angustifolius]
MVTRFSLQSSLNGSASNHPDGAGRSFATTFSGQSGAASSAFHHSGANQGLHIIHGSFNVPNMSSTLTSRNSIINNIPPGGVQQPTGNLSSGRFASNNLPAALSQLSHSGVTNRGGISVGNPGFGSSTNGVGGSIPGTLPTSAAIGNRNAVPGLGVSQFLGNAGPQITSSVGNMVGGNIGRNGGGLSMPGFASRLNLSTNSGSGGLGVQGQSRLMSGVLPHVNQTLKVRIREAGVEKMECLESYSHMSAISHFGIFLATNFMCSHSHRSAIGYEYVISMLGNSYPSAGGPLSQSHVEAGSNLNSMGMLNDMNTNDSSPFDINDFPQLTSRPSSAGGHQGQLGSLRKQGIGIGPIVQQNQEFSIQNEDFPALPGFKGGNADYAMDMHQKEQLHDNAVPMMQSQHFSMGRSADFSSGGTYSSHRAQQQQHASSSGPPGIGLRPPSSANAISGMGSYDQFIQQYQQHQNQPQFRLQMSTVNQSFRDQGMKSTQTTQSTPDPFGLLGLLSVIRMSDPDLTSLALGVDLTILGLNLNSTENLHKTFGSPWFDEQAKGDPEINVPQCYYAKQPPDLHQGYFLKFSLETLFYIFYSMPKDEAQLYAAYELYSRGWFYHKLHHLWLIRVPNMEPLVKTATYERGSYHCFDPTTFETVRKDNLVLHYEMVEKRPLISQH